MEPSGGRVFQAGETANAKAQWQENSSCVPMALSIKYIHIVVKLSPISISRTFSSSHTETLYPLNNNFPFPSLPTALGNHHPNFCLYEFGYSMYL